MKLSQDLTQTLDKVNDTSKLQSIAQQFQDCIEKGHLTDAVAKILIVSIEKKEIAEPITSIPAALFCSIANKLYKEIPSSHCTNYITVKLLRDCVKR